MLEFLKKGLLKTLNSMNSLKTGEKISKDLLETMLLEADVSYENRGGNFILLAPKR